MSLTMTPMMCASLLKPRVDKPRGYFYHASERAFAATLEGYRRSLDWALAHGRVMLLAATVSCNIYLYNIVPKGFFLQQDVGRLSGNI